MLLLLFCITLFPHWMFLKNLCWKFLHEWFFVHKEVKNLWCIRFFLNIIYPLFYWWNFLNIDFPGNIYEIIDIVKIDEKELKKTINNENANLKVRNLSIKTIELIKKLKIKDGGKYFVFATKLLDGKNRLIICNKVNR